MRRDPLDFRETISRAAIKFRNLIRRVVLARTPDGAQWQALGYRGFEGNAPDLQGERFEAEVFPGIGFRARPKDGASPEAVIVHVGGEPNHPVIVATRDRSMEVALQDDETAIFTSVSVVLLKKDGTIEARSRNGTAVPLATKADVENLRTHYISHEHPVATSGTATSQTGTAGPLAGLTVPPAPPPVVGTQKGRME